MSSTSSAFDEAADGGRYGEGEDGEEGEGYSLLPSLATGPVRVLGARYYRGVHRWWKGFDNRYMKPVFGGSSTSAAAASAAGALGAPQRWLGERGAGVEGAGLLEEGEEEGDVLLWSSSNASEPEEEEREVQELSSSSSSSGVRPPSRGQGAHNPPKKARSLSYDGGGGNNAKNPRASPVIHHRGSGRVSPLGVMGK